MCRSRGLPSDPDYRPIRISGHKIKKQSEHLILELEPTEDILKSLGEQKRADQLLIGFAAESDSAEEYALGKLKRKNLDWIAANRIGVPGEGFEAETNAIVLFSKTGERHVLPLDSKANIAGKMLDLIFEEK